MRLLNHWLSPHHKGQKEMSLNVQMIARLMLNALVVLVFTPALLVTDAAAEELENLYQIEFILFKQAEPDLSVLEFEKATNDASAPERFLTVFPYLAQPLSSFQRAGLDEAAELSLADQTERLTKKGYQVLQQGVWQEQIANDSRSLPVRLSSDERPFDCPFWSWICTSSQHEGQEVDIENSTMTEEFRGQLVIRRSRYMHAELSVDYYFKQPVRYTSLLEYLEIPLDNPAPVSALLIPSVQSDEESMFFADQESKLINVKSFTFKQSRRVKNNEIHYLDHPYLGMIVSIKRIEQSEYQ